MKKWRRYVGDVVAGLDGNVQRGFSTYRWKGDHITNLIITPI